MISIRTVSIGILILGILLLHLADPSAHGCSMPRPLTPLEQVPQADVIVVGKIVEIEDFDSEVTSHPGIPQKTAYKIANIQIKEALVGAKGLTHIRVGFIPGNSTGYYRKSWAASGLTYPINLFEISEEGCFFLSKHHEGDFYMELPFGNRIDFRLPDCDLELEKVKKSVRVLENPMEVLRAKDPQDRQFAVNALLSMYKTRPRQGTLKEVEIPKEESKLILETLSKMENDPNNADQLSTFINLFSLLQLTDRDGWIPPKQNEQGNNNVLIKESFDKWFKANGEKYCVKKWVIAKK